MKIYLNRIGVISRKNLMNKFFLSNKYNFSSKINDNQEDEDEYSIINLTNDKIKILKKEIETKIVDGQYSIRNDVVFKNYFGEIPLFFAPAENFQRRNNIEKSGLALISSISILNYIGLLYPPSLFPYFAILTATCVFKLATSSGQRNQIILMTLVDDKNVRIKYLNGVEEIASIKSIMYNSNDRLNYMTNPDDDTFKKRIDPKRNSERSGSFNETSRMIMLSILVNSKKKVLILKNNILPNKHDYGSKLAFADLLLLLSVLNKKTKRINFQEKSNDQ